ncbi:MAG: Phthiocerol synthesis polyketide synthase type I PpsC [Alphaproteobacteria bacterium MarineAlpha2_Bin1]|mgnify:CR=1 FL=1|nr:MAG: Phthiocerol synthesis polyketide synthase type I PpsC [Alphaproteobacteria bacterium MarineAlpha2_Bin1]|tara:strand:- start:339 stop:1316 length:978 start_codon:yes stop_codon:yes gene_type:complete
MKYVDITKNGGSEVLQIKEVTAPSPKKGQILIKVAAAGVNRPDVLQRMGLYPPPSGAAPYPGLEVAGTIEKIGNGVTGFNEGQQVCALLAGGGYAEYCVVPYQQVLPVPKNLSIIEAASIPETYFTVWSNIFDIGKLKKGERILIHGGSSGIGTTAIQLCNTFGSEVYVTVGNDEKRNACIDIGAKKAINYNKEDFYESINEYTDSKGVNIILDMVSGDYVNKNIKLLTHKGRLIFIAFLKGPKAEANFGLVMQKKLLITGSTLRPQSKYFKGKIAKKLYEQVWPLFEQKKIKPIIDSVYPIEEVSKAHDRMESNKHIGKIVLTF